MRLKWVENKPVKGKQCLELDEEFGIYLSVFKCTKGTLVGQCNPAVDDYHWVTTCGIAMGSGKKLDGHSPTEKQAMEDAEKSVLSLLEWRQVCYNDYSNAIRRHIRRIEKYKEKMKGGDA